jgi:hypothetical protein
LLRVKDIVTIHPGTDSDAPEAVCGPEAHANSFTLSMLPPSTLQAALASRVHNMSRFGCLLSTERLIFTRHQPPAVKTLGLGSLL